jgi:flagellar motor protein MotB
MHIYRLIFTALLTSLLFACAPAVEKSELPAQVGRMEADKLLPVDCLLPATVRKLGTRLNYLAARKAIKTTARDCEIRGGEYIAYNRSDYRTALNVWLERAQLGDAVAQTYVGEIYEKGLGLAPDYSTAHTWYLKAAEQNHSRAQINLGYLYEKGLGVNKDPVVALNWYRKASGVTEDDIDYTSTIEVKAASLAQEQNELMRQEIKRREREIQQLKSSLESTRQQMKDSQQQLQRAREKLRKLDQQMDEVSGSSSLKQELEAKLKQQELIIHQSELHIADLQTRIAAEQTSLQRKTTHVDTQKQQLVAGDIPGPRIEVFDPSFAITRGGEPTVRVRAGSRARMVRGRVDAPGGLNLISINENPITPNKYGVFHSAVSVAEEAQRVLIFAKDQLGQSASFSFMLIPESLPTPEAPDPNHLSRVAGNIDFGRYYALVIGNNEYRHFPRLESAINDARTVAVILREKYGFDTRFIPNADRYTMLSALNEIKAKLTEKDNLVIYYAGHGERDVNTLQGYWLPTDAEQENTANWIPNSAISDLLNTMPAKHILVVADSCYSGSMTSSSVARLNTQLSDDHLKKWLKVMSRTHSRTVLTSGGIAPVLDTGGGGHSVFAQAFIEELRQAQGVVDAYKIYLNVSGKVQQNSAQLGFDQQPTYAPIQFTGHSGGEFIFVKS